MMRKWIALLLVFCMAAGLAVAGAEGTEINWAEQQREKLRVGNTTALTGNFFTTLWGGTTSDLDVQDLLHGYVLVRYNLEGSQFLFDDSVVQAAGAVDDTEGNRTYMLALYDDLKWSDGTPITAKDYAFTILFTMDPVITETGGTPAAYSWLKGAEEYLRKEKNTVSGLRIMGDDVLQITVRAEALPYFYELSRLMIHPYPASVIAPGVQVQDDGEGAYLSAPLSADTIRETVLDPKTGYLFHPSVVSGPYMLTSYEGSTAKFTINPYFKGTEKGMVPRIGELEYTLADNADMLEKLNKGEFGLLNKVTLSRSIWEGLLNEKDEDFKCLMENYPRVGLTLLWFRESSRPMQDPAVRRAIACCFDRESFTSEYAGPFGLKMDAFCGLGQWMYLLAAGSIGAPVDPELTEEEQATEAARYSQLNLDGLTEYAQDTDKAAGILEDAGWTLNSRGIRSKTMEGQETELRLTLGLPNSREAKEALEKYLVSPLKTVGIEVTLKPMAMTAVERIYKGEAADVDMLYLGEDFSILLDPEILKPQEDGEAFSGEDSLTGAKAELYKLAEEMVRTEPADLYGFMQKWIALQVRISETLPLLPVYSNVYFDFYNRELHDYHITQSVTWGEAIVSSYMSDVEDLGGVEKQIILEELEKLKGQFASPRGEHTEQTE